MKPPTAPAIWFRPYMIGTLDTISDKLTAILSIIHTNTNTSIKLNIVVMILLKDFPI